ncbi:hypothetical protein M8818_005097 [Zalaria obscura]|uniref:Uncharacterized protein n=1 Tax=Zalaria obscura TaxID=2024903 RepID=A0ACC3SBI9_9PEZI
MSGPSVYFTLPSPSLFKFPPDSHPPALPPPTEQGSFRSPFPIDYDTFNNALRVEVPLTIAACYIVSVTLINQFNRSRGWKPWWISTTRPFKLFVILHNVFLAIYSAVTFAAMFRALSHTWPGFDIHSNGLAGVADAFCKLHGPRGLGDAAVFNSSTTSWEIKNKLIHLAPEGTPDPTDVGRLWNEGLAFWGWFFYLSKFYEVVDTLIIVAKGKRSATLQTYHHAGAMMCMWAGIRYMSPPIWMFVFINSFIHSLMYTYFTLAALRIRVPVAIKRTLTTMQIAQFLFGASFAAAHLFVKYDVPVSTAYTILHPISSLSSAISSTAAKLSTTATDAATSPTASFGAALKRFLLRAAGDEGVAENVRDRHGDVIMAGAREAVQRYHEETRWKNEYHTVDCIDTSGQSFAIWLNLFYLAPLTALFVRFFVRSYIYRTDAKPQSKGHAIKSASIEAAKGVNREVDDVGKVAEDGIRRLSEGAKDLNEQVRKDLKSMREGRFQGVRKVSERVQSYEKKVKTQAEKLAEKASQEAEELQVKEQTEKLLQKVKEGAQATKEQVQEKLGEVSEKVQDRGEQVKEEAPETGKDIEDNVEQAGQDVTYGAKKTEKKAEKKAGEVADDAKQGVQEAAEDAKAGAHDAAEKAEDETAESEHKPKSGSEVQPGKGFADALKEGLKEGEEQGQEQEQGQEEEQEQEQPQPAYADVLKAGIDKDEEEAKDSEDKAEGDDEGMGSMVDVAKEREVEDGAEGEAEGETEHKQA